MNEPAQTAGLKVDLLEQIIDGFIEDYEMVGETADGRDACYTPNERERILIKDAIFGLLADAEWGNLIEQRAKEAAPAATPPNAAEPAQEQEELEQLLRSHAEAIRAWAAWRPEHRTPLGPLVTRADEVKRAIHAMLAAASPSAPQGNAGEKAVAQAARDVLAERQRQIDAEGWHTDHDDAHANGEMAMAAACYAAHSSVWTAIEHTTVRDKPGLAQRLVSAQEFVHRMWPWGKAWWKPKDDRRNLVRAAALILAEIERLDRKADASPTPPSAGNVEPVTKLPTELRDAFEAETSEATFQGFAESRAADMVNSLSRVIYRMGFQNGWEIRERLAVSGVDGGEAGADGVGGNDGR